MDDPVYYDNSDGKWYFYNELWTDSYGPFETEEEARDALKQYAKTL